MLIDKFFMLCSLNSVYYDMEGLHVGLHLPSKRIVSLTVNIDWLWWCFCPLTLHECWLKATFVSKFGIPFGMIFCSVLENAVIHNVVGKGCHASKHG